MKDSYLEREVPTSVEEDHDDDDQYNNGELAKH
jgi:hypothetical protein